MKAGYEDYLTAGAAIRGARLLAEAEIGAAADEITADRVRCGETAGTRGPLRRPYIDRSQPPLEAGNAAIDPAAVFV